MSEKFRPVSYGKLLFEMGQYFWDSKLLYKMGQDFLDRQYVPDL